MKKKAILLIAVILLSTAGLIQAQERNISGTFDVTYLSRYIWRGFDMYEDDHSAIQPSIDLDLYGTGLGIKILWSIANTSGFEDDEWLNYTLYYNNSLFQAQTYTTDYTVGWGYYNYPDSSPKASDLQEFFAAFSWPEICPAGVVPSYTVVLMWPSRSNSTFASDYGGWLHVFGLDYDITVPELVSEIPVRTIHLSTDLVYNDGVLGADSGFSHMVFGLSTDLEIRNNLTFTPAAYYQSSWESSVNGENEFWVGLSMKYKF